MKKLVCLDMSMEQVHMVEISIVCKIINIENDIRQLDKILDVTHDRDTKKDLEETQKKLKKYQTLLSEIRGSY